MLIAGAFSILQPTGLFSHSYNFQGCVHPFAPLRCKRSRCRTLSLRSSPGFLLSLLARTPITPVAALREGYEGRCMSRSRPDTGPPSIYASRVAVNTHNPVLAIQDDCNSHLTLSRTNPVPLNLSKCLRYTSGWAGGSWYSLIGDSAFADKPLVSRNSLNRQNETVKFVRLYPTNVSTTVQMVQDTNDNNTRSPDMKVWTEKHWVLPPAEGPELDEVQ